MARLFVRCRYAPSVRAFIFERGLFSGKVFRILICVVDLSEEMSRTDLFRVRMCVVSKYSLCYEYSSGASNGLRFLQIRT